MLVLGSSLVTWPVRLLFEPSGVLVGLVHFSMPTMILILAAALAHVDPALERAAASLGARPARVFARVTLPLSMPGGVSGSLIVFAWTFSAFAPHGLSLRWYENALTYPQFQRAAVNSLIVTAAATLLALPIGTAAALALVRHRVAARAVWAAALLSPLVVPGVAAGLGFL